MEHAQAVAKAQREAGGYRALIIPLGVVAIVVMLVVPLPTWVLDLLITSDITGAVLVLLTAMQVRRPLDFSVFPTLLLIATMFRLAIDVSATRLVLLHAYAGSVIEAFGHFVIGGSLVVGLVVFLILIVIQLVVITNGSGRVAEVAARFTLDAMPGKQMAIDADLHAGLIDEAEARRRRQEVTDEADFYGAMDGASKFVKGDAIAAIVIAAINLIGGLAIGVVQKHMGITEAIHTYSLLSVGDGLVSQIPALLMSLSTGIIVTRAATESDLGTNVVAQLARYRHVVRTAGVVMAVLGLIPGLPTLPFLLVGAAVFVLGTRLPTEEAAIARQREEESKRQETGEVQEAPTQLAQEMAVEALELELGLGLIDLVDPARGGDLLKRVRALRRTIAADLGLVIPPIHTRDNLDLPHDTYAIRIHGVEVARGQAPAGRLLALGTNLDRVMGEPTVDPAFGGPAKWIRLDQRHQAALAGLTVVDRSSVLTTHLSEIVRRHAAELLSRQDTKHLVDSLRGRAPALVEDMATAGLGIGEVQGVLRALLDEQVPIRDLARIVEAAVDQARVARDPDSLLEAVRIALGPAITAQSAHDGTLDTLTLAPVLEAELVAAVRPGEHSRTLAISPQLAERVIRETITQVRAAESEGVTPVLVVHSRLRAPLARLLRPSIPRLTVLAAQELRGEVTIVQRGVIDRASETV